MVSGFNHFVINSDVVQPGIITDSSLIAFLNTASLNCKPLYISIVGSNASGTVLMNAFGGTDFIVYAGFFVDGIFMLSRDTLGVWHIEQYSIKN